MKDKAPLVKLKDTTIKIGSGATPRGGKRSYKEEGISLIRSLNVYDLRFDSTDLAYIDKEQASQLDNVKVESQDILLNITGASVARCCMVPDSVLPARVNQHVSIIRIDTEQANPYYILYCLVSPLFKSQLLMLAQGGATREALTKTTIENFKVPLPERQIQDRIANILTSFDDLIEVNLKCTKVLEDLAQCLYDEWFVSFRFPGYQNTKIVQTSKGAIPEGWSITPLSSMVDNIKKKETSGPHLHNLAYVPIGCISKKSLFLKDVELGKLAKSSLIRFRKYDILFGAMRPYFHKVTIAPSDGVTRTTCFVIRPKNTLYYSYSVMTMFQESTINYANSRSTGSTIPYAVWGNGLADMQIVVPSEEILERFNSIVMPNFEELTNIHFKVKILEKIRELLLPRLISEEIDVNTLDL